ncbi:DUF5723 family protein [Zhouia sp. PK063]|uniref:DUF5723 family protein n=1 Tax=Zhouia sp. PK063 TaxID=3373602 RepID=UPI00378EEE24
MKNKIILITIFIICAVSGLKAQNNPLLYDFKDIPQSLLLNPGTAFNAKWHAGVPFLSGVFVSGGLSNVSVYDIFGNDGRDINDKIQEVIYSQNRKDAGYLNEQIDIFNGGYASKNEKDYYSFGMYQETDIMGYWPKDIAILVYEGNTIGTSFNLGDLNGKGELLTVYHFGITRKISDQLTIGGRVKLYNSIFNIDATKISGTFTTVEDNTNFYAHEIVANMAIKTAGVTPWVDEEGEAFIDTQKMGDLIKERFFLGGDLGLGADIGFTYDWNPQWTVTGSLIDIGFVSHTKDVENYTIDGAYTTSGLKFIPENKSDNSDAWQDLKDDIQEKIPYERNTNKYTTFRPVKLNASVKYKFGDASDGTCDCLAGSKNEERYSDAVGLQLFAVERPRGPQTALTAFYYKRLFSFLNAKATYTADKYSKTNFGLGISTHFANFNAYVLMGDVLKYTNIAKANTASLQFGINYIVPNR